MNCLKKLSQRSAAGFLLLAFGATALANSSGSASGSLDGVNFTLTATVEPGVSPAMYTVYSTASSGNTSHTGDAKKHVTGEGSGLCEVSHDGKTYTVEVDSETGTVKDLVDGKSGIKLKIKEKKEKPKPKTVPRKSTNYKS